MHRVKVAVAGLVIGALLATGCGGGDDDGSGPFGAGGPSGDVGDVGDGDGGDAGDFGDLADAADRPDNVEDLVLALYGGLAANDADATCGLFTPSGEVQLLEDTGMPTCEAAVDAIAQQVVDAEAFAHPTIEVDEPDATELDEWCSTGIHVGWPDLDRPVFDGDLGAFAYSQQPDGTWAVTDYNTFSCGG